MDYRERWELKDYLIGRTLGRRIVLFQVALLVLLLAFLLNFWYLQVLHGEEYAHLAENNRLRKIRMPPTRGVIFDRKGEVLAATRPSLDLVLLRQGESGVDRQLEELAPILHTSHEALVERKQLMERQPPYQPLVLREDVELEELAQIEARRELFPSLEVRQSARRSYPQGSLFGHVLGYVGEVSEAELERGVELQAGDIVGKTGLERAYDELLRGSRGWNLVSVNNTGRRVAGPWVGQEPLHGETLHLTLDVDLQRALKEALGDEVGAGVFLDARNGEVLALASTPDFNPSLFADGITREAWQAITEDPARPLHDRAISSFYAPGSAFKVVIAIAGLETGTITAEEQVHCSGSTSVYGRRRLCWKRGGHGNVDLRRALAESCNVYFYRLGKKLGIDAIHHYGELFRLGRPTGIDLTGESAGILPSRAWKREHVGEPWYPGDTISVAIGQGLLAVTPVQLAAMISSVGTGREPVRPHLVKGRGERPDPLELKLHTYEVIRSALRQAVESGTGRAAGLESIDVAGKTGTAQVYKQSAGVDSNDLPKEKRDHGWFVGYAPAVRPRIAFAVVIEHGGHGGTSAAPVARQVLEVFFAEPNAPPKARTDMRPDGGRTRKRAPAAG